MFNSLILFASLFATWVVFSGFMTGYFLVTGAVCCLIAVLFAWRMAVIDHETHPLYLNIRAPFYFIWLLKEMLLSSLDVAIRVWQAELKITPVLGWIKSSQKSEEAKVVFANSIIMTPGTVCTNIKGNMLEVHALEEANFKSLSEGGMDAKVTRSFN